MTRLNNKGYTLVEVILALTLFMTVLLVSTVGFIGINRTYSKGMIAKQSSESVQRLVRDIEGTLRQTKLGEVDICSNQSGTEGSGVWRRLCLANTCYFWNDGENGGGGLYRSSKRSTDCNDSVDLATQAQNSISVTKLVDNRFIIRRLNLSQVANASDSPLFQIKGSLTTPGIDESIADGNGEYAITLTSENTFQCKPPSDSTSNNICSAQNFSVMISTRASS